MKIRLFLFLFICINSLDLIAQNEKMSTQNGGNHPFYKKAVIEYNALHYATVIDLLLQFKLKYPYYLEGTEMLAESYRLIKDYKNALYWYEQLCSQIPVKSDWALHYAETLANNKQYELSAKWYRQYLLLAPEDKRAIKFTKTDIQSLLKKNDEYRVFNTNLNTPASEYSPIYYKDGLIYSSNKGKNSKYVFQWDKTSYTDLYVIDNLENIVTDTISNRYQSSIESYKVNKNVNSSYHEGSAVILPEGNLIFTRNNYNSGKAKTSINGVNKLKLYTAKGAGWKNIEEFPYNSNEYSVGHPAISPKGDILIFTSDKQDGFGGTDLYYCVRIGPERLWGKPVNMGPKINTEGNEMFPYWDKDNKLYFSSTGHAGLGGLDIFEVLLKDMKPQYPPRNLGSPINSFGDDFGIINNLNGKNGFFTSNRFGNDDIFSFVKKTYDLFLKGKVIDALTKKAISESKILIQTNDGTQVLQTDQNGIFNIKLNTETDYDMLAQKRNYLSGETFLTTDGIDKDSTFNVVIQLNQPRKEQQFAVDNCDSLKKVFSVQSIFYDLDKYAIRADARPVVDALAKLMSTYPNINIITSSHTDTRASSQYNIKLSQNRGLAVKAYLISKGIAKNRISIQYYGKSHLVNNCDDQPCTEDMQQLNRRTEVEIIYNGVNLTRMDCSH